MIIQLALLGLGVPVVTAAAALMLFFAGDAIERRLDAIDAPIEVPVDAGAGESFGEVSLGYDREDPRPD